MGLFNFENLPVNTLVGTSLDTFNKVTYGGSEGDKKYKGKISSGEVGLPMKDSNLILPCGIYGLWESSEDK